MPKKLTQEEFLIRDKQIHGSTYDYSLVEYRGINFKIKIICKNHGVFEQTPGHHINRGDGCIKCKFVFDTKSFIDNSILIHSEKYDYSLVEYINSEIKVKIICSEHGVFEQEPHSHLKGCGCFECGRKISHDKCTYNSHEFIHKAAQIHNSKYDYSLVEYVHNKQKVKIICNTHGIFLQAPCNIYSEMGVPSAPLRFPNPKLPGWMI
jgi:hypothetical protein